MKQYKLVGQDGQQYISSEPGSLGGYRRGKYRIYGKLDCRSALSYIAKGHYVPFRVFFKDEPTAVKAGFRPCGICMPAEHKVWKAAGGKDV